MKTSDDVRAAQEALGAELDRFLRARGWNHTSKTPGCYWLWEKDLGDGRRVLVQRDMALVIEELLETGEQARCADCDANEAARAACEPETACPLHGIQP